MQKIQLAIIGAGPAAWTAAIYASRAQLAPTVFTGFKMGGQLMWTTEVENFPGFPDGIRGPELMGRMQKQAQKFGSQLISAYVTAVDFSQKPFKLWTKLPVGFDSLEDLVQSLPPAEIPTKLTKVKSSEPDFTAEAVIIATGAASIMLHVPGEKEFLGRGVSTCAVCDAAFFKDKNVYVVGGGDTAMEDSLALAKFAKQVTIIHRRDEFKASKLMQGRVLKHPKIKVLWQSEVKEILGKNKIEQIKILVNKQEKMLKAEGLFLAVGHRPMNQIFAGEVKLDQAGYILTQTHSKFSSMTNVEGVFASGDGVDSKYQQAITAAGLGCQAALDAERYLEKL